VAITIRAGDFAAFFAAPFECYGADAYVASPLKGDLKRALDAHKNPLFRDFARRTWFTAHRDGRIVGRILTHIHDASNRKYGLTRGYFGMFDCIDDAEVARALLDAAAAWLRDHGCNEIAGSFNLTITQMIGVVTEGFENRPYIYQDWSPPHICRSLVANGFEPFYGMRTFEIDVTRLDPAGVLNDNSRLLLHDPEWRFEPIGKRGLEARLKECRVVLNDGFADNAMFVPLTEEEFLFPCAGMTAIIDEHLSWMAYHRGEPAGVYLCIPDLNPFLHATRYRLKLATPWHLWQLKRHRSRAAVIFYSVRQAFHGRGVNSVLLHKSLTAMRERGYTHLGVSWISDTNAGSLRQMDKLGARPLHRLQLFRKPIPVTA
jgi:GNAT superfamily N-acetyltransferase